MAYKIDRKNLPHYHPGITLKEWLDERDMSIKELAVRMDRTEQLVLSLIECKTPVSSDLALSLEYVTGISAEFWLNKQQGYELYQLRQQQSHAEAELKSWLSSLPMDEMMRKGWVGEKTDNPVGEMLHYYGVTSINAWKNYYFNQRLRVAFRISLEGTVNPYALSAWLRRGEIQAREVNIDEKYSKEALKKALPGIVDFILHPTDDMLDVLQEWLRIIGIKLIYTEPLSGVPIKGASRWIHGHPCIQLPKQHEMYDSFVYTILHELGHIYLHGKKDIFLENVGYLDETPKAYERKEAEADEFAKKWIQANHISDEEEVGKHPSNCIL